MTQDSDGRRGAPGSLVFRDGEEFPGEWFGPPVPRAGEVVFNTGMTGYEEILTDPSYAGQIVALTYPQVGNYGLSPDFRQSGRPQVEGLLVEDLWPAGGLEDYLAAAGIPILAGVDIRALVRRLRQGGDQGAALRPAAARQEGAGAAARQEGAGAAARPEGVGSEARRWGPGAVARPLGPGGVLPGLPPGILPSVLPGALPPLVWSGSGAGARGAWSSGATRPRLIDRVTCARPYVLAEPAALPAPRVVIIDFGSKEGIARSLARRGCRVIMVPAGASVAGILALGPDGIVLSNGPGDPADCRRLLPAVRRLSRTIPTLGICLGHQILALAFGGRTMRLPFGHRGSNHPVRELAHAGLGPGTGQTGPGPEPRPSRGRVLITSQNHGFAVDPARLPPDVSVTHEHVNDGSIEGLRHLRHPWFSVQYHPEAGPGPTDSEDVFDDFLSAVRLWALGGDAGVGETP